MLVVDDDAEMVYLAQYLLETMWLSNPIPQWILSKASKKIYGREAWMSVMLDLTMPNGASEQISDFMVSQNHAKHPIIFVTGMTAGRNRASSQTGRSPGFENCSGIAQAILD